MKFMRYDKYPIKQRQPWIEYESLPTRPRQQENVKQPRTAGVTRSATFPPTSARTSWPSPPTSPRNSALERGASVPWLRTARTTRFATSPLRWPLLSTEDHWHNIVQRCVCALGFIEVSGECRALQDFTCADTRNVSQVFPVPWTSCWLHNKVSLENFF